MCYSLPIGSEINEKIGNPVQFEAPEIQFNKETMKEFMIENYEFKKNQIVMKETLINDIKGYFNLKEINKSILIAHKSRAQIIKHLEEWETRINDRVLLWVKVYYVETIQGKRVMVIRDMELEVSG